MIKPIVAMGAALVVALHAASCSQADDPVGQASTSPVAPAATVPSPVDAAAKPDPARSPLSSTASLAHKMDCVRETGALPAAHRGGPRRGYPENALETLKESYQRGSRVFEIDIAESKDGVLFLMHDVDLARTTTSEGVAREMSWSQLSTVTLTANDEDTGFLIPTLREALEWAVANNALLELDKKRSTDFATIIHAVREAGAQNHVVLITYTRDQAEEVAKLAPEMMMTATVETPDDLEDLIRRGVKLENLIAWTGTEAPDPALWADLKARGIEVAFGTLGRRGERLDDVYWEDRDGSEYDQLIAQGVTLIATDYSDKVTRHLAADDRAIAACGF